MAVALIKHVTSTVYTIPSWQIRHVHTRTTYRIGSDIHPETTPSATGTLEPQHSCLQQHQKQCPHSVCALSGVIACRL
jgi:hypothetical protein